MPTKWLIGLVLIFLGVGVLLDAYGVWSFPLILRTYWPLAFVLVGVNNLVRWPRRPWGAVLLILIGVLLQIWRLQLLPGNFAALLWAIALIFLGALLLIPRRKRQPVPVPMIERGPTATPQQSRFAGRVQHNTAFGGSQLQAEPGLFRGGTVSVLFGGVEVDLRGAELPPDGADLQISAIFGGVHVQVPESWPVLMQGTPFLGGCENHARLRSAAAGQPALRIRCDVILGGVEVRH